MGVAGSKVSEVEEEPQALPLPRCQTTLPGEAPAPPQISLKRRRNRAEEVVKSGRQEKRQRLSVASQTSADPGDTSTALTTPRSPAIAGTFGAHTDARGFIRRKAQPTEANTLHGNAEANATGAPSKGIRVECGDDSAFHVAIQQSHQPWHNGVKTNSDATWGGQERLLPLPSRSLDTDLSQDNYLEDRTELIPVTGSNDGQSLRTRLSKSPSPEQVIDETPGLRPAPPARLSVSQRQENRRQIQQAIDALSSSPSKLADIQAAVNTNETPSMAPKRRPLHAPQDYVGFVPKDDTKAKQHTTAKKAKKPQSHAKGPSTSSGPSKNGSRQRKMSGLWKGWEGNLFKEDFE